MLNEFAGVLAEISAEREGDGPMGKSDRALMIGFLPDLFLFFFFLPFRMDRLPVLRHGHTTDLEHDQSPSKRDQMTIASHSIPEEILWILAVIFGYCSAALPSSTCSDNAAIPRY